MVYREAGIVLAEESPPVPRVGFWRRLGMWWARMGQEKWAAEIKKSIYQQKMMVYVGYGHLLESDSSLYDLKLLPTLADSVRAAAPGDPWITPEYHYEVPAHWVPIVRERIIKLCRAYIATIRAELVTPASHQLASGKGAKK